MILGPRLDVVSLINMQERFQDGTTYLSEGRLEHRLRRRREGFD